MKRLWFIKCILPLPNAEDRIDPRTAAKVLVGGLTAMAGPVAGIAASLFADVLGNGQERLEIAGKPYRMETPGMKPRWNHRTSVFLKSDFAYTTGDGKEAFSGWGWMNTPMKATSYETREAAETEAFNFVAVCPHFIGKLEIVSMRATWLSS